MTRKPADSQYLLSLQGASAVLPSAHPSDSSALPKAVRHWLDGMPVGSPGAIDLGQLPDEAKSYVELLEGRTSVLEPGRATGRLMATALQLLGTDRTSQIDTYGRVWQSRAQPSAGGTHSIEPLLQTLDVEGWPAGWYRQEGPMLGAVSTVELTDPGPLEAAQRGSLRHVTPAAVLYAIVDFRLIEERYPGGTSLMWRDAGSFLMTAHLLATAFGTSSSILGMCAPVVSQLDGSTFQPFAVGALAIGGPTSPAYTPDEDGATNGD